VRVDVYRYTFIWFYTIRSYWDVIFPLSSAIPAKLLRTWCHSNCNPMNKFHLKIHQNTTTYQQTLRKYYHLELMKNSKWIFAQHFFLQYKTGETLRKIERDQSQRGNTEHCVKLSNQPQLAMWSLLFLILQCAWLAARTLYGNHDNPDVTRPLYLKHETGCTRISTM
jgi:hypothetical protein